MAGKLPGGSVVVPLESGVSLYFLHADRGQSVLIKIPVNRWIVVDSNQAPGGAPNATVEALRQHAERPSFQLTAAVITHLHHDHYSGMVEVLELCEEVARRQKRKLRDVLQTLILPLSFKLFHQYLERNRGGPGRGHLKAFIRLLRRLEAEGIPCPELQPLQHCWGTGQASRGVWAFNFHPSPEVVTRGLFVDGHLREEAGAASHLQEVENRFAYILGVGCGTTPGSVHCLLTSDIPGRVFHELTSKLRDELVSEALSDRFGARKGMLPLIYDEDGLNRLWPVQVVTVPHHGSRVDPATAEDLDWWLAKDRRPPERPAIAIAQGGRYTLGEETASELSRARLQIFATSPPERLLARYRTCPELDARLPPPFAAKRPARPPVPSDQFAASAPVDFLAPGRPAWYLQRESAAENPMPNDLDAPTSPPHLAVRGGEPGVQRVVAREIYEIRVGPALIVHHELTQVFPAPGAERAGT